MTFEPQRTIRRLELEAAAALALATRTSREDGARRWADAVARHLAAASVRVWMRGEPELLVTAGDPGERAAAIRQPLDFCGGTLGWVELRGSLDDEGAGLLARACALLAEVAGRDELDSENVAATLWSLVSAGSWPAASRHVLSQARLLTGAPQAVLGVRLPAGRLRVLATIGCDAASVRPDAGAEGYLDLRCADGTFDAADWMQVGAPAVQRQVALPVSDGGIELGLLAVANRPQEFEPVHVARLERLARLATHVCRGYASHRQERLLESQLRHAQHMESVGRLAACLAHEFNNLLTIIGGQCTLLIEEQASDPRESLLDISDAAQRAGSLVSDLLAYSRKQVVRPQRFNVNETLRRLEPALENLLGDSCAVQLNLADRLSDIVADPTRIEQVVVNLALHAREAMPKGGRLTIETAEVELDEAACGERLNVKPGNYAVISVSDTGRGIDPALRPHIFEPFLTGKSFGQKCGLGLASAEGIVTQAGGHLRVSSEVGRGTTFSICLPLSRTSSLASPG